MTTRMWEAVAAPGQGRRSRGVGGAACTCRVRRSIAAPTTASSSSTHGAGVLPDPAPSCSPAPPHSWDFEPASAADNSAFAMWVAAAERLVLLASGRCASRRSAACAAFTAAFCRRRASRTPRAALASRGGRARALLVAPHVLPPLAVTSSAALSAVCDPRPRWLRPPRSPAPARSSGGQVALSGASLLGRPAIRSAQCPASAGDRIRRTTARRGQPPPHRRACDRRIGEGGLQGLFDFPAGRPRQSVPVLRSRGRRRPAQALPRPGRAAPTAGAAPHPSGLRLRRPQRRPEVEQPTQGVAGRSRASGLTTQAPCVGLRRALISLARAA